MLNVPEAPAPPHSCTLTGFPTATRSNSHRAVALLVRMQPWLRRTPNRSPARSCHGAG
jgi:hypothetical protein